MAKFTFKSILPGFKRLVGMTAEVYNENGDLLDSIELNNTRKRFSFKFDKEDALQDSKNADLSIKLIDNNGDDFNFSGRGVKQFDLDTDEQTFTTSISANKRRGRAKFRPTKELVDTNAPVFTSGDTGSIDENVAPGTLVYDADANDASAISFALSGGDSADFTIDSKTGLVTINQSPDFESKSSYSFNVVATDSQSKEATQDVVITVNDIEEGKTINLSPLLDTITANDLSNQSDLVEAGLGTLGVDFQDSIVDSSSTDNDLLKITTNGAFDLHESLDASEINRIQNIETIQVIASNDDLDGGQEVDLSKVVNLKTLDVDGTFTETLRLENWADTGATEFDYSGITSTEGVVANLGNAGNQTFAENLNIKGSAGDDILNGLNGNVTMVGLAGDDFLIGSREGSSVIEGGAGTDSLFLWTHNAQHTVRLHGQTSDISKDSILFNSFQGFENSNAKATNTFDLIEIDAVTFSNYTANQAVQQQSINSVLATTNLSNTVVTSTSQAGHEAKNFDNNGDGILGFAADTGMLLFSASGNFSRDAQELLEIGAVEGANFVPVQQINVV